LRKLLYAISSLSLVFLVGCNNPFEGNKVGVKCDKKSVVNLVESIMNNDFTKGDVSIKIDPLNIVEWDYKNGRYLCKAKVSGTYNKNISYVKKVALQSYGLSFDEKNNKVNGWIFYQTYLPTVEMKKLKENKDYIFYAEILNASKLPKW